MKEGYLPASTISIAVSGIDSANGNAEGSDIQTKGKIAIFFV